MNPNSKILGIRAEEYSKWERRSPLTPANCKELLSAVPGLKILVEASNTRVFQNIEFKAAGCEIVTDLSSCDLILGIKQIPIGKFIPGKTHMFFSHTIKAQPQNMAMLDDMLAKKIRTIDYEKICNDKGERLVAFGEYAGFVGALDILAGLGHFLLNKKFATPFLWLSQSFRYSDKNEAKRSLANVGKAIKEKGLPLEMVPFVVGITGYGRCGHGSMEVLESLGIEEIEPHKLKNLLEEAKKDRQKHSHTVYLVKFAQEHMVKKAEGADKVFDKKDYYAHPEKYVSIFEETYLEYVSVLINCIYWEGKYPRLITNSNIKKISTENRLRLLAISDVTCDFQGSIEMLDKFTTIDQPFFVFHPETGKRSDEYWNETEGILYDSVEIMPSELPMDASKAIGAMLVNFIPNVLSSDPNKPLHEQGLLPPIEGAVITLNGELTPKFKYINTLRKQTETFKESFADKRKVGLIKNRRFKRVKLNGHIFDRDVLKDLMDIIVEEEKLEIMVTGIKVGGGSTLPSECELMVEVDSEDNFSSKAKKLLEKKGIDFTEF